MRGGSLNLPCRFQLHHTGIKTGVSLFTSLTTSNFNCTIQELKHLRNKQQKPLFNYFNCTIQELKRDGAMVEYGLVGEFQLHHTGIKTLNSGEMVLNHSQFQLHHTGIKTTGEYFFFHIV